MLFTVFLMSKFAYITVFFCSLLSFPWKLMKLITEIILYIFMFAVSSSSSGRTISTDIPDPFSPPLSIVHRFRQVFRATSCIGTELLYVGSSWTSCLCSSMWTGPLVYVAYEFVPPSPAVSRMSGSSNLNSFRDGSQVAIQLLLCGVLSPRLVQYC